MQIYLLGTREIVIGGVISRYPLRGRGAAAPNLTQIFNVFRLIVWRSTAAKPNEVEISFMQRFAGQGKLKLMCVTDRGYFAGWRGTSPPNMTPILHEIGTFAETRISPKRLVIFGNNLPCVIAGA